MRTLASFFSKRESRQLAEKLLKIPLRHVVQQNSCSGSCPSSSGRTSGEILPQICRQATQVLGRERFQQLQQIQLELRRQRHALMTRLASAEGRVTSFGKTFANSLTCSLNGQNVVVLGIPLLASFSLSPTEAHCDQRQHRPKIKSINHNFRRHSEPVKLFSDWMEAAKEEVYTGLRGLYLMLLFMPVLMLSPICVGTGWGWHQWVEILRWTLERAGPAFIKWGQWAATRPDLFPPDVCEALTRLHSGAPSHSYLYTRQAIEKAFKRNMDDIFSSFETAPVASGSIAQVHRGVLNDGGSFGSKYKPGTVVAVKVRHPGVTILMQRDFILMRRAAVLCSKLPKLRNLRLEESVRQFGGPLKEQLDLSTEARALAKFNSNFKYWPNVLFPAPVYPLVAEDVLVETFEPGRLISRHVDSPTNVYNESVGNLGLQTYLKMLLVDNFIHADLHPGNILVRVTDPNSLWGRITNYFNIQTSPKLILLDVGMTAELLPEDQQSLIDLFRAITEQDGYRLARNILDFSDGQTCEDPEAFIRDMSSIFDGLDLNDIAAHTSEIMQSMMEKIRHHQVNLKGVVSTVVVTTLVLEGWSTKLNPDIRILDALKKMLPRPYTEHLALSAEVLFKEGGASL